MSIEEHVRRLCLFPLAPFTVYQCLPDKELFRTVILCLNTPAGLIRSYHSFPSVDPVKGLAVSDFRQFTELNCARLDDIDKLRFWFWIDLGWYRLRFEYLIRYLQTLESSF